MGIMVNYRGVMQDVERVEELEDRVLDMALEIGASARVWRSIADNDPRRVVRGLILDLSPGQETTSLVLSPEGWLVPLLEIEAAEKGNLSEPPWCFVKTQFGSVEGHVALIELLSFLKQEFFPGLDVSDEGGYWESRDLASLVDRFAQSQAIIASIAEGLRASPLSAEAAEDPAIVAARVERIARQVHAALSRPPEHPPVLFEDDGPDWDELDEAHWDASYKEQRRKQERLQRAIEEQIQHGTDHREAFENAMRNEGIIDLPGEQDEQDAMELMEELEDLEDEEENEPWRESLPPALLDEEDVLDEEEDDPFDSRDVERHPLLQAASDLHLRLHQLFKDAGREQSSHLDTLLRGVGEISGGLAQALSEYPTMRDGLDRGLALVQLKRALRGAAFAKGALYPLHAERLLDTADFEHLRAALKQLDDGITEELNRVRQERSQ